MTIDEAIDQLLTAKRERILTVGITTGEAALLLGVSEATAKRWANAGKIVAGETRGAHRRYSLNSVLIVAASRPSKTVAK